MLVFLGGRHTAQEAHTLGLIDHLFEKQDKIVEAAIAFAKTLKNEDLPMRRLSALSVSNRNHVRELNG